MNPNERVLSLVPRTDPEHAWLPSERYEYFPAGPEWTTSPGVINARKCRQFGCDRPAAAALLRGTKRPRWWCYCDDPEHMYGRRIENGRVMDFRVRYDPIEEAHR